MKFYFLHNYLYHETYVQHLLILFFFMITFAKVFGDAFYRFTSSISMTVLRAILTSTVCHATFKKPCKSRAQHSTCNPCHLNSHCLIRTCT